MSNQTMVQDSPQPSSKLPNVAKAGGIMMASIFLSRVLGIGRDTIMATLFGRGDMTDAYALAFQIPDFIFYLLASGALSSAFIPVFSEYYHTNREKDAWKVFSSVVTYTTIIVGLLILLAFIFAEPLLAIVAGGKSGPLSDLIVHMSRIILPGQLAFLVGGLMFGTLYARQKFLVPGLGPNIYNLSIIFGALVISHFVSPGIVGMAWGALIGAILGNLILPAMMLAKLGSEYKFSLDKNHPGVKKVFKFMLPVIFGLSLPAFYGMLMRAFGSYYPSGIVTSLDMGNKLMQAPLGIFGQGLALAIFPALSQFFAQGRMDLYGAQISRTLKTVLYISIPASVFMFVLAEDIVTVLLQYGKFTHKDTMNVTDCFQMYALGIGAWCMQPILMRGYYSIQNTFKPVLLGTLTTGVFVVLAVALHNTSMSYLGLPLACSLSAVFLAVAMLKSLSKDAGHLEISGIMSTLFKSLSASLIMGAILYTLLNLYPEKTGLTQNLNSLIKLLVLGLGTLWGYYGITRMLKMPETEYLTRTFKKLKLVR